MASRRWGGDRLGQVAVAIPGVHGIPSPVAETGGIVMAVAHTAAPQLGVQFHPESILTPDGGRIIDTVMHWAIHARG